MQGSSREGREGESGSVITRHSISLVAKRDLRDPDLKHCFANAWSSVTEIVENEKKENKNLNCRQRKNFLCPNKTSIP